MSFGPVPMDTAQLGSRGVDWKLGETLAGGVNLLIFYNLVRTATEHYS